MSDRSLQAMLNTQEAFQMYINGKKPVEMEGDERARFFTDMTAALIFELGEASNEIGWKPWASDRSLDHDKYVGELIDAWHFFMNLMLIAGVTEEELYDRYMEKMNVNLRRHAVKGSYTGKDKCPNCHRDLLEVAVFAHTKHTRFPEVTFCSPICAREYA